MYAQSITVWCLYTTDAASVRLLTDDGAPSSELNTEPARTLAEPTVGIHAAAYCLGDHELRHLEQTIALQRCRR